MGTFFVLYIIFKRRDVYVTMIIQMLNKLKLITSELFWFIHKRCQCYSKHGVERKLFTNGQTSDFVCFSVCKLQPASGEDRRVFRGRQRIRCYHGIEASWKDTYTGHILWIIWYSKKWRLSKMFLTPPQCVLLLDKSLTHCWPTMGCAAILSEKQSGPGRLDKWYIDNKQTDR